MQGKHFQLEKSFIQNIHTILLISFYLCQIGYLCSRSDSHFHYQSQVDFSNSIQIDDEKVLTKSLNAAITMGTSL